MTNVHHLPVHPRPEVEVFAQCMEQKLRKNDHKRGWQELHKNELCRLLVGELVELLASLGITAPEQTQLVLDACGSLTWEDYQSNPELEAIDVGVIAMMLHDNLRHGR